MGTDAANDAGIREVVGRVRELLGGAGGRSIVMAIDGRSGAGKSTLAVRLAAALGERAAVIEAPSAGRTRRGRSTGAPGDGCGSR